MKLIDKMNVVAMRAAAVECAKEEDEKIFRIMDWIVDMQERGIIVVKDEVEV